MTPGNRYRLITVHMWDDDKFKALSKPKPNAQTLWIYLLTGQHTTAFPGVFVAGMAQLAEAISWRISQFRKIFEEILKNNLARYDKNTRLMFLPNAVIHNPPQSPNVVKAWRRIYETLPDCDLKTEVFQRTITNLRRLGFGVAFTKELGEPYQLGIKDDLPKAIVEDMRESGTGTGTRTGTGTSILKSNIKNSESLSRVKASASPISETDFKKIWGPVERDLRKSIDPETFAKYYEGIEVREVTPACVMIAVPEALIERNGGCTGTASFLTAHIQNKKYAVLRDRRLTVVLREPHA